MEEYRVIKECPNYEVSDLGNIRNKNTKYIMKPYKRSGYLTIALRNGNDKVYHGVHIFVAKAFLDNPENKKTVNHKNKIRDDNRKENLEWATYSEQQIHKNKDTEKIIKYNYPSIWRIDKITNEKIEKYETIAYAVKWLLENNITKNKDCRHNISSVLRGDVPTSYGYKWSYDESVTENLEGEIWKEIPLYLIGNNPNFYVSNLGRFKKNNGHIPKIPNNDIEYVYISINKISYVIHRIILSTFSPHENSDNLYVNHKDGNKKNNKLENLEWSTNSENVQHAYDTGLNKNCKKIIQYDLNMKEIKRFNSINQAARELNIHNTTIIRCCLNQITNPRKFFFKYEDEIFNKNMKKNDQ